MGDRGHMDFRVGDVTVAENASANIGFFGRSSDDLLNSLPIAQQASYDMLKEECAPKEERTPLCHPGTRLAVLEEMRSFIHGDSKQNIFWLNGMAGTGKSTIARTLATELDEGKQLGASFFFRRGGGDVAHSRRFFTTIAWQLARKSKLEELKKLVCKGIEEEPDIGTKIKNKQWSILIQQPLSNIRQMSPPRILVIIVDALDECDSDHDIEDIVALLAKVEEILPVRVRIVVTSRPEIPIKLGFDRIPAIVHRALVLHDRPRDEVNADLRLFFNDRINEIKELQFFSDAEWPGIKEINRLVELSDGLFVFAAALCSFLAENEAEGFLIHMLSSTRDGPRFLQEIEVDEYVKAFKHLDTLYMKILAKSLEGRESHFVKALRNTLGAIAVLQGPLSVVSLAKLMSCPRPGVIFDQLKRLHSVVRISKDSNTPLQTHDSFREFLVDHRRCTLAELRVDEESSHLYLFRECLETMYAVLRQDVCKLRDAGTMSVDLDPGKVEEYLPLHVQYACQYWTCHAQSCTSTLGEVAKEVAAKAHKFLKVHFLHWVEAMGLIRRVNEAVESLSQLEVCLNAIGGEEVSMTQVSTIVHFNSAATNLRNSHLNLTAGQRVSESWNFHS